MRKRIEVMRRRGNKRKYYIGVLHDYKERRRSLGEL